ncbi:MAG: TrkA-related ion transporter [Planctomycetota bacterium]
MSSPQAVADALGDHYVICNWNDLGDAIIRELHASVLGERRPIVIVTDQPERVPQAEPETEEDPYHNVFVIPGDPTSDRILARASIAQANTAIVLSDPREGKHADTKTVLIALAIEAIEPGVHTIVELLESRSRIHFKYTHVDEVVCVDELAEKLLAQTAITHGLSEFYLRLLTATEDTNEVYVLEVPEAFVGKTYRQLEHALVEYSSEDVILVGVQTEEIKTEDGETLTNNRARPLRTRMLTINPPCLENMPPGKRLKDRNYVLQASDRLFLIAYRPPRLDRLEPPGEDRTP